MKAGPKGLVGLGLPAALRPLTPGKGGGYVKTFLRSSAAVAVNDNGQYVQFAAGALRQIGSKVTVEPARTNLTPSPNDFTTADWNRVTVTTTPGQTGPTGLGLPATLIQDTAGSNSRLQNASAFTPGVGVTVAFTHRFKRGNTDWIRVSANRTSGLSNRDDVWVNLATLASSRAFAGTGCGYVSHDVRPLADGFCEVEVVIVNPTTSLYLTVATATADGNVATAGVGANYLLSLRQVEVGSRATSPIVDVSGSRAADMVSLRQPNAFYDWTFTFPNAATQVISVPGTGLLAVESLDQWTYVAPPVRGGLTDKLATAKAAWSAATTMSSDIVVLGDSVVAGSAAPTYAERWINVMRERLRTMFPSGVAGGEGYLSSEAPGIAGFPWVQTSGAESYNDSYGPKRRASSMLSAASFRFIKPGTSVDLMHTNQSSGGTYSYSLDGGAATDVSTVGGTQGGIKTRVSLGGGQVDIAWVSGNVKFEGAVHYNGDETKGVRVHECGKPGRTAVGWNTGTNPALWPKSVVALAPKPQDVVVIPLGINDWTADTPPADLSAAFEGMMASMIGAGFVGKFVLMLYFQPSGTHTYSWGEYRAVMAALEAARADTKFIDISQFIAPVASHPSDFADFVHPYAAVHQQIGELVPALLAA